MVPKVDIQPWGRAGGENFSLITFRAGPSKGEVTMTRQILELFSPHLILGVSDELPPNAEIRKLAMVSELVQDFTP
ncbi:MAG TPA: hypothetical protein VKK79_03400 [Candidatus Lokiarchaeia archaeon]|nr:hypothetical protein [Candidatus Lokiarchaeia archaeon]